LEKGEDITGHYGFGILSYFNVIRSLAWLFFVLTIVHLPLFYMYKTHGNALHLEKHSFFNGFTLGNLGQSSTECTITPLPTNRITLTCNTGSIQKISY